jgi:hypothetical protein
LWLLSSEAEFGRVERWGRGMKIYLLMLLVSTIIVMANLSDWRKRVRQDRA